MTRSQRIVLVLAGILVALGIAEAGMRIVGFALQAPQERRNQATPRSSASSEDIRILALGESTTAAYFVAGDATDWPKQLERILNERRPDKRFTVYNEGIGGYQHGVHSGCAERQPGTHPTRLGDYHDGGQR